MRLARRLALLSCVVVGLAPIACAEQELDPGKVYRVQPRSQELVEVPVEKLKDGFVYKYFHPQLGRHVWGVAAEGRGFRYAFGPGSTQPVDRFPLELTAAQKLAILKEQVPGLGEALLRTGREVFLILDNDDRWQLFPASSVRKVFDLVSGRRWEWHGRQRVRVVHSSGHLWQWDGERYQPLRAWSGGIACSR